MLATSLWTHCVCYQWTSCLSNCLSREQIVGVRMETAFNLTATNSIYFLSIVLTTYQVPSGKDASNSGNRLKNDLGNAILLILNTYTCADSRQPNWVPQDDQGSFVLIVGIEKPSRVMEHIGTPQCAEPFDSRNGHTVPNDSGSMNSWIRE